MSDVILSVAAFATPYATFPICFCAAQCEMFTINPRVAGTISRAAN